MNISTELQKLIDLLSRHGFKIYAPIERRETAKTTYLFFVKDNKIGYVQDNRYGGLSFSTRHKLNSRTGTGFQVGDGLTKGLLAAAEECFAIAPQWAGSKDRQSVVKYDSWEDYISDPVNNIIKYREVTT